MTPARYFDLTAEHRLIPVGRLKLTEQPEAQPESVATAERYMTQAFAGQRAKREPILVRELPSGEFLVIDGNATAAVAMRWNWTEIPAILERAGEREQV